MRWRPTLAALAAIAAVGVLAVAMSSASAPTASASLEEPGVGRPSEAPTGGPVAAVAEPDPTGGPDTATANSEGDLAEADRPSEGAGEGDPPGGHDPAADPTDAAGAPDPADARGGPATAILGDGVPTICPDPSDPFFALYRAGETCYWLRFEDELHEGLTAEELALIESVPSVAGYVAEPLGRPARKILRAPRGEAGAPRLYLTFDDGPSTRWTRPTLDLLDRYGARATFFPVGAYAAVNFRLIEEIAARGHTLGTHLWSHEAAALASEEVFRRELRASADVLGDLGTACLRTPYGIVNDDILEWAGDEGFEVVLWGDVDPLDWQLPSIEELTERILGGVRNGTILLLHERTGANTLAALDAVLEALDARGWRFDEPICPLRF